MSFILIARSTGDELIPPKDTIIATSYSKKRLERLRDDRLKERTEWLATHKLPWWAEECVIAEDRIEEVKDVD